VNSLLRWTSAAVAGLVAAAAGSSARAEPHLAIQTGLRCSSCHVNVTGGGGRTDYGAGFGRQTLPRAASVRTSGIFDGALAEGVRIGADLRGGYRRSLPDEGEDIGEFSLDSATLYLSVELLPGRLGLYLDERVAPGGASNREAFVLLRPAAGMWVKAGRFFPPYGLRLQDEGAFTRAATGFGFGTSDTGVEVGWEPDRWSVAAAVTNGSRGAVELDDGKEFLIRAAHVRDRWRLGVSASDNDLPEGARRRVGGVFGGLRWGKVTALAAWDRIRDEPEPTMRTEADAAHVQLDWTPVQGLTLRGWAGWHDPDRDLGADRRKQQGVGADWTLLPGLQVRSFYRRRDGPAEVAGTRDDQVLLELHLYFYAAGRPERCARGAPGVG
jgi:hypothetical protein